MKVFFILVVFLFFFYIFSLSWHFGSALAVFVTSNRLILDDFTDPANLPAHIHFSRCICDCFSLDGCLAEQLAML